MKTECFVLEMCECFDYLLKAVSQKFLKSQR